MAVNLTLEQLVEKLKEHGVDADEKTTDEKARMSLLHDLYCNYREAISTFMQANSLLDDGKGTKACYDMGKIFVGAVIMSFGKPVPGLTREQNSAMMSMAVGITFCGAITELLHGEASKSTFPHLDRELLGRCLALAVEGRTKEVSDILLEYERPIVEAQKAMAEAAE